MMSMPRKRGRGGGCRKGHIFHMYSLSWTSGKFFSLQTPTLGQTFQEKASSSFVQSGHHSCDKKNQGFPLPFLHVVSKIGQWEGLETKLGWSGFFFPKPSNLSLVPRPFPPPVFDRLQYAKTEGEGLGERVTCVTSGRHEGGGARLLYSQSLH